MLCHQCGSPVSSGDTSCANCGAQLERDTRQFERSADDLRRMTQSLRAVDADRFFPPGEVLADRFELRALIGRGPFGEVYRAEDSVIEAEVAVKVFDPELTADPRHQERFVEAASAARSMTQTNVVRVHHSGVHRDHGWVSMQLLEGLNLAKLLKMRRKKGEGFHLEEVEPVVSQVTLALQHINREYPHGDLEPSNVMMLPDLVKVTDHYIFAATDIDLFAERRADSDFVAPEILVGRESIDVRSDVYSLGMIIGRMVFGPDYQPGESPQGDAEWEGVARLCERATAADPDRRYESVEALSEDFATLVDTGELLDASVDAPPVPRQESSSLEEVSVPPPAPSVPASEASIEDEIATREYDRDDPQAGGPDVSELLETREMDRDDYPSDSPAPPPSPEGDMASEAPGQERPPVEPTAIARHDRPKTRRTGGDDGGRPRGWMAVAAVALLAMFAGFLWLADRSNEKESEPVEIGDEGSAEGDKARAERESQEKKKRERKERLGEASARAGDELWTAHGEALGALEEAAKREGDDEESPDEEEGEEGAAADEAKEEQASADDGADRGGGDKGGQGAASRDKGGKAAATDGTDCKGGMVLVRDDGGNFCIDAYEFPGRGSVPDTNVSWFDAEKSCKSRGKRLCKLAEWRRACGASFPYGQEFDASQCNTVDEDEFERDLAAAGSFDECQSWTGAYDMSGNAHEWVQEQQIAGGGYDSGGEMASCGYASKKDPGSAAPNIGFRCCADAQ